MVSSLHLVVFVALVVCQCEARISPVPGQVLDYIKGNLSLIELQAKQFISATAQSEGTYALHLGLPDSQEPFIIIQILADPTTLTYQLSLPEQVQSKILQEIKNRFQLNKADIIEVMKQLSPLLEQKVRDLAPAVYADQGLLECPYPDDSQANCDQTRKYRTIDGSCNNLQNPLWGRSYRPFQRCLDPDYADGIESPRVSASGNPLPNARKVSRKISDGKNNPDPVHTFLLTVFGQFLDHDITHTALSVMTAKDINGQVTMASVKCGATGCETKGIGNGNCFPITILGPDPEFPSHRCLMFVRSQAGSADNCVLGPRQQFNQITSYIDASNIYGSTEEKLNKLRDVSQPDRGRLLIDSHPLGFKGFLPFYDDPSCREVDSTIKCFMSGDVRVNEHMGLTALHTTYHRYHNVIEEKLHQVNPNWSGDRLFEEARKVVIAIWQHHVYNEFLPLILGPKIIKKYGLELEKSGYWNGYDESVNPEIINSFAAAAYRFGHSTIPKEFPIINKDKVVEDTLLLSQVFNRPKMMYKSYTSGASPMDGILRGMYQTPMQKVDKDLTRQVTAKLFSENPPLGPGTDLFALNVQRGRDHGIPGYAAWREWCGLHVPKGFDDLTDIRQKQRRLLRYLYDSIEDVDLFGAGLLERRVPGGVVGPTFACIIAKQFRNLRTGDRFWYEREDPVTGFTSDQLNEIRKMVLARVICDTGDDVDRIQRYVLLQPISKAFKNFKRKTYRKIYSLAGLYKGCKNEQEQCSDLPDLDIQKWQDVS